MDDDQNVLVKYYGANVHKWEEDQEYFVKLSKIENDPKYKYLNDFDIYFTD
eukprot:CAMPEP_0116916342 /NCGR_PEP_ID=MMETSP0467-20121206/18472_1 /TAXON_ID=283647 /ORGANISM="Mesodinium pulex, Strain SPMC105" /LENGTH=50 /DNA_ID=CAMNT_0004593189 /DNA_START=1559 /DNA_END=1711 /DNA_ORIENTATION=+